MYTVVPSGLKRLEKKRVPWACVHGFPWLGLKPSGWCCFQFVVGEVEALRGLG